MRTVSHTLILLAWTLAVSLGLWGQSPEPGHIARGEHEIAPGGSSPTPAAMSAKAPQTPLSTNEIGEHVFKREEEQVEIIASYAPIVETEIQGTHTPVGLRTHIAKPPGGIRAFTR